MKAKLKSHSGCKKRFKKTSSGKVKVKRSNTRHILVNKSPKRMRRLAQSHYLSKGFEKAVKALMPYA